MKSIKLSIFVAGSLVATMGMSTYIGNTNSSLSKTVTAEADYLKDSITEKDNRDNYMYIVSCADPSDDLCADGYDDTNRSKKLLDSSIV